MTVSHLWHPPRSTRLNLYWRRGCLVCVDIGGDSVGTFDLLSTGAASLGGELLVLTSSAASCSYAMLATPEGGAEPIELAGLEQGRPAYFDHSWKSLAFLRCVGRVSVGIATYKGARPWTVKFRS